MNVSNRREMDEDMEEEEDDVYQTGIYLLIIYIF